MNRKIFFLLGFAFLWACEIPTEPASYECHGSYIKSCVKLSEGNETYASVTIEDVKPGLLLIDIAAYEALPYIFSIRGYKDRVLEFSAFVRDYQPSLDIAHWRVEVPFDTTVPFALLAAASLRNRKDVVGVYRWKGGEFPMRSLGACSSQNVVQPRGM